MKCSVKNWGDTLNVPLVKHIIGADPKCLRLKAPVPSGEVGYMVIGSILKFVNENIVVWGPGFISMKSRIAGHPKKVCAVRGPLTREKLLTQGISCPEIFGDPALLYPKFYTPKNVKKKYKLGVIPHYIDKKVPTVNNFRDKDGVLVIDIQGSINQVVDDILSCERIAASCLHGIIAADAYGVPSTWIKFSNRVIGNGFKFRDYFASVRRKDMEPLVVKDSTTIQQVLDQFHEYKIDIDLDKLYSACPFKRN